MDYWVAATIGSVVLAGSSILAWVKFWIDWGKLVQRVDGASSMALGAHGQATILQTQLHDFEVKVARDYATSSTILAVEARMHDTVNEFRKDIRGLSERLDRVLDARGEQ
jgi:ubiquinone biosynthesis protein UbiJ